MYLVLSKKVHHGWLIFYTQKPALITLERAFGQSELATGAILKKATG